MAKLVSAIARFGLPKDLLSQLYLKKTVSMVLEQASKSNASQLSALAYALALLDAQYPRGERRDFNILRCARAVFKAMKVLENNFSELEFAYQDQYRNARNYFLTCYHSEFPESKQNLISTHSERFFTPQPTTRIVHTSHFQKEVTLFLTKHVDSTLKVEHQIDKSMPPVDIVLSESKRIVQVDGPSHYLFDFDVNKPLMPTPKTLMYDNIYKAKGWEVIHVCFQEWQEASGKTKEMTDEEIMASRLAYLEKLGLVQNPKSVVEFESAP